MSKNLTSLQKLTHLKLDLRGYLLIEISLFNSFHSFNQVTHSGRMCVRNNLKRFSTVYIQG